MTAQPQPSRSRGLFVSFEGTEGSGKSTQIQKLAARLLAHGVRVRTIREPGGTPIGEEIRHLVKHSAANHAMCAETELLLMNASRAQLVHEVIQPALASGEVVLTDRFLDSTIVYQGYGRGLDLDRVGSVIDVAVGNTRPDLTLLLFVPLEISERRRASRELQTGPVRDRLEEAGREFFARVEEGYRAIARAEPDRIRWIAAEASVEEVGDQIWQIIAPKLGLSSHPGTAVREH